MVSRACAEIIAAMVQRAASSPDRVIRSLPIVAAHMAVHVDANLQQSELASFSCLGVEIALQPSSTGRPPKLQHLPVLGKPLPGPRTPEHPQLRCKAVKGTQDDARSVCPAPSHIATAAGSKAASWTWWRLHKVCT